MYKGLPGTEIHSESEVVYGDKRSRTNCVLNICDNFINFYYLHAWNCNKITYSAKLVCKKK